MPAKQNYELAQCQVSAKNILIGLGVRPDLLPGVLEPEVWHPSAPVVLRLERPKRFRRTKEELRQLDEFEQWQLQQRELKRKV